MNDDTSTTTSDILRHIADALDQGNLPDPRPSVHWFQCDDDTLRSIMAAFPDAKWRPVQGGNGSEWVTAYVGGVELTAFAVDPEPVRSPRLPALLAGQAVSA